MWHYVCSIDRSVSNRSAILILKGQLDTTLQPVQSTDKGSKKKHHSKLRVTLRKLTGVFLFPWFLVPFVSDVHVLAVLWFYQMIKYLAFLCSRICDPGFLYSELIQNNTLAEHSPFLAKVPRQKAYLMPTWTKQTIVPSQM